MYPLLQMGGEWQKMEQKKKKVENCIDPDKTACLQMYMFWSVGLKELTHVLEQEFLSEQTV